MITITDPAIPPTVPGGSSLTFKGTGGPAVNYKVLDSGGSTVQNQNINPPTPVNWSQTITAPTPAGRYTFRISDGKQSADKGFTVGPGNEGE